MSSDTSSSETDTICFRMEEGGKQRITMRAAQLGYSSKSDYLRDLVSEDLEDVQFIVE